MEYKHKKIYIWSYILILYDEQLIIYVFILFVNPCSLRSFIVWKNKHEAIFFLVLHWIKKVKLVWNDISEIKCYSFC